MEPHDPPHSCGHLQSEHARITRWRQANPWRYRELRQREYARRRKVTVEPVDPFAVHARDGGLCVICGGPVLPNDASFSLDYVLSIPKGGAHAFDNVRTSHLLCKMARRAHLPPPTPLGAIPHV